MFDPRVGVLVTQIVGQRNDELSALTVKLAKQTNPNPSKPDDCTIDCAAVDNRFKEL